MVMKFMRGVVLMLDGSLVLFPGWEFFVLAQTLKVVKLLNPA